MGFAKRGRARSWMAVPGMALLLGGQAARADNDFVVYSPYVFQGQSEVAAYGYTMQDARPDLNGTAAYNFSVAHAFTRRWKSELYFGQFNRAPGSTLVPSGYEFENTFQLTDTGAYWADFGFVASYAYIRQPGQPSQFEFGPLIERDSEHLDQRLNLMWEKQVGDSASRQYMFRAAYSLRYLHEFAQSSLGPGLEAYYRPVDHSRQIGPALYGEVRGHGKKELEWSLGVVYGANSGAPTRTLIARAEYEFL
jgi:hypothetical protein